MSAREGKPSPENEQGLNKMPSRETSLLVGNVFVKQDACLGVAQQPRQRGLSVQEWEIAQILAIVLDQVKGIEDCNMGRRPPP
jgi:hypothetical protein